MTDEQIETLESTKTPLELSIDDLNLPYSISPIWAWIHDVVCHPLLAITGCATWAVKFHDYTSTKSYTP